MATKFQRIQVFLCFVYFSSGVCSDQDRVLFRDVNVLTLQRGQYTNGHRSAPVPQLNCVGGSAKEHFSPSVVQCTKKGYDGHNDQWECTSDMEDFYRFGELEVTCEGYDYPDDVYILKGSCGLEYKLEMTEKGHRYFKHRNHYTDDGTHHQFSPHTRTWSKYSSQFVNPLLFVGIVVMIYALYKFCLVPNVEINTDSVRMTDSNFGDQRPPPPYGFHQEYMSGSGSRHDRGCHGNSWSQGSGFWTGAATAGILGYLFGRNTGHTSYRQPYTSRINRDHHTHPTDFFSGFHGSSPMSSSCGSGDVPSTRTAYGFGGTKRR